MLLHLPLDPYRWPLTLGSVQNYLFLLVLRDICECSGVPDIQHTMLKVPSLLSFSFSTLCLPVAHVWFIRIVMSVW